MNMVEMKVAELIGQPLDWAVADCLGMTGPVGRVPTWDEVKDLEIPFSMYDTNENWDDNGNLLDCTVDEVTITRAGIMERCSIPTLTFTGPFGQGVCGIGMFYLDRAEAEKAAILTMAGGAYDEDFTPSSAWSQGGPIIDKEGIDLYCSLPTNPTHERAEWRGSWRAAYCRMGYGSEKIFGGTALIAAMRCYVQFMRGETVSVPENLVS